MNIAITGASGFVGSRLTERLLRQRHSVHPLSLRNELNPRELEGMTAVVHLAGEPVGQRWSRDVRRKILESRREGTRKLVTAMRASPPNVLVSASAIGYYGARGDEILTEQSKPGEGFLCDVAKVWEEEAMKAADYGVRVARLRIGVILGPGGALKKMLLPFRLGLGAHLGSGKQWMSWIHVDDVVSLIDFVIHEKTLRGALNATSPNPVTNLEFTKTLASTLNRPAIFTAPRFALKLLYGDMAQMILDSQRVLPEATVAAGFVFDYPDLQGSLLEILG